MKVSKVGEKCYLLLSLEISRGLDPEEVSKSPGDCPWRQIAPSPQSTEGVPYKRPHVPKTPGPAAAHGVYVLNCQKPQQKTKRISLLNLGFSNLCGLWVLIDRERVLLSLILWGFRWDSWRRHFLWVAELLSFSQLFVTCDCDFGGVINRPSWAECGNSVWAQKFLLNPVTVSHRNGPFERAADGFCFFFLSFPFFYHYFF